jgi:hypothetical protein
MHIIGLSPCRKVARKGLCPLCFDRATHDMLLIPLCHSERSEESVNRHASPTEKFANRSFTTFRMTVLLLLYVILPSEFHEILPLSMTAFSNSHSTSRSLAPAIRSLTYPEIYTYLPIYFNPVLLQITAIAPVSKVVSA